MSGYVNDSHSIEHITSNHQIGDIIDLAVVEDFDSETDGRYDKALIILEVPADPSTK